MTPPLIWAFQTLNGKLRLNVRDSANCAMVTMGERIETTVALSNGMIDDPLRPPLPQNWVPNAPLVICRISNGRLRNGWSDPLHVWFSGRVFGVGESNGALAPVSYVTLRNWVSMFTPDFINFRWHVHIAIALNVLVFAGMINFTVCYLGHMLFIHAEGRRQGTGQIWSQSNNKTSVSARWVDTVSTWRIVPDIRNYRSRDSLHLAVIVDGFCVSVQNLSQIRKKHCRVIAKNIFCNI